LATDLETFICINLQGYNVALLPQMSLCEVCEQLSFDLTAVRNYKTGPTVALDDIDKWSIFTIFSENCPQIIFFGNFYLCGLMMNAELHQKLEL
jgi:hypothetical protein